MTWCIGIEFKKEKERFQRKENYPPLCDLLVVLVVVELLLSSLWLSLLPFFPLVVQLGFECFECFERPLLSLRCCLVDRGARCWRSTRPWWTPGSCTPRWWGWPWRPAGRSLGSCARRGTAPDRIGKGEWLMCDKWETLKFEARKEGGMVMKRIGDEDESLIVNLEHEFVSSLEYGPNEHGLELLVERLVLRTAHVHHSPLKVWTNENEMKTLREIRLIILSVSVSLLSLFLFGYNHHQHHTTSTVASSHLPWVDLLLGMSPRMKKARGMTKTRSEHGYRWRSRDSWKERKARQKKSFDEKKKEKKKKRRREDWKDTVCKEINDNELVTSGLELSIELSSSLNFLHHFTRIKDLRQRKKKNRQRKKKKKKR